MCVKCVRRRVHVYLCFRQVFKSCSVLIEQFLHVFLPAGVLDHKPHSLLKRHLSRSSLGGGLVDEMCYCQVPPIKLDTVFFLFNPNKPLLTGA